MLERFEYAGDSEQILRILEPSANLAELRVKAFEYDDAGRAVKTIDSGWSPVVNITVMTSVTPPLWLTRIPE